MTVFGLIGFPLTHSFSKKYFTEKFLKEGIEDCRYDLFPIADISLLSLLLEEQDSLRGINVTIPHKINVLPYLQEMDEAAREIGAVNCISIDRREGKTWLKGYNTDAWGFQGSLEPLLQSHHTKALVLGDGGAAKAVKYVLGLLGISYLSVVRKPVPGAIRYEEITPQIMTDHLLVINTTPLGTFPNVEAAPDLPYHLFTDRHLAYDLIYNPEETTFLHHAKAAGAGVKNGLQMLHLQAERAWSVWNA